VLESGAVSAEHVLNVLGRLNASALPAPVDTTLVLQEVPRADAGLSGILCVSGRLSYR